VWLESTAGHTPDHVSVHVASRGAEAVITGDLIHSPVQCLETEWVPRPDFDPKQAAVTRRGFLERYCERDVLICASHFPSPSFGRVVREGNGFWFEYAKS
jgi:glyoxylase-like metal-dependent hydrolase (beta-lactamase superfamily II)